MKKLKLINLSDLGNYGTQDHFEPFAVGQYEFNSSDRVVRQGTIRTHSVASGAANVRIHKQNGFVRFSERQENSILFKGGLVGVPNGVTRNRKFIEDILVLGTVLTSHNWALYSRRYTSSYPVVPKNHLRCISRDDNEISVDLNHLINVLKGEEWQQNYNNGFHLIMLVNNANILNIESRFLSQVVIWEFLYAQIFGESYDLQTIICGLLRHFWGDRINEDAFQARPKNIFYVLRNQLAHSGRVPIDRSSAEDWMRELPWETPFGVSTKGIDRYLRFFTELTQVIVLKTMDFHPEERELFNVFGFNDNLTRFLETGRI